MREWLIRVILTLGLTLFLLFCILIVGMIDYFLKGKISTIIIPISAISATGLGTFLFMFFLAPEIVSEPISSRIFSSVSMSLLAMVGGVASLGLLTIILIILAFGYIWCSDDCFDLI